MVYAVFVSLGFALWENISYVMNYGFSTALVRAVTAIPGHACFGVFMGVFYGAAKKYANAGSAGVSKVCRVLAVLFPALLHGAYDYIASMEQTDGNWYFIGFVAVMFLVVRIIDVIWDPMVGAIVDKSHPRWGKYRSWLLLGAVLLATFATLCFWNGFSGSLLYAYITYVGMSMSFTFVNVPYAALGSSLTRDTDEITILTSVRMVMANLAGLIIKTLPLVIVLFAPKVLNPQTGEMEAVYNTPEAGGAWFITMSIFALVGLVLLLVTFSNLPFKRIADTLNGCADGLFGSGAFDGEGVGRSTGFGFLNARHFLNGTDYGCLAMAAMHVLNTEDGHIRI